MWWLIPTGIGGAAYFILQSLKSKAQVEYDRWESTYLQTQERLRRHREAIAEHVESTRYCCEFRSLCELHFASVKIADEAYRLLRDAKGAEKEIRKSISDLKASMEEVYRQTKSPGLSKHDREKLHAQLAELKKVKESLFKTAEPIAKQIGHFLAEVRQLNRKTRDLKCAIRDCCGLRGAEWYKQREARNRVRDVCRASCAE